MPDPGNNLKYSDAVLYNEGGQMEVQILYIDDCPAFSKAEEMIKRVLDEFDVKDAEIERIRVGSFAEAETLKFLGSPTIRINGKDIEPDAHRRTEYEMAPRSYHVKGSMQDLPDIKWLKAAVKNAKADDDQKADKLAKGKGKRAKFGAKPVPRAKKGGAKTFKGRKK
jgi:hypothetical protein